MLNPFPLSFTVPLDHVIRIMDGQTTKGFQRFKGKLHGHKERSLSIVYTEGRPSYTGC
jgi:hypothetical protein